MRTSGNKHYALQCFPVPDQPVGPRKPSKNPGKAAPDVAVLSRDGGKLLDVEASKIQDFIMVSIPGQKEAQEHPSDAKKGTSSLAMDFSISSGVKQPSTSAQNVISEKAVIPVQKTSEGLHYIGTVSALEDTALTQACTGQDGNLVQVRGNDAQEILNMATPNAAKAETMPAVSIGDKSQYQASAVAQMNHKTPLPSSVTPEQYVKDKLQLCVQEAPQKPPGLLPWKPELGSPDLDICADNGDSEK